MPLAFKAVAQEWAKIDPKGAKDAKHPTSVIVAQFVKDLNGYDRDRFLDGVSRDVDAGNYKKTFSARNKDLLDRLKDKSISAKEKEFLLQFKNMTGIEADFWGSDPIGSKRVLPIDGDLRKGWQEAKKAAEAAYRRQHPSGPAFPCKFDEAYGPLLEKFEKTKIHRDRTKLAVSAHKVCTSYAQQVIKNKAALGEEAHTVLMRQLRRINEYTSKWASG